MALNLKKEGAVSRRGKPDLNTLVYGKVPPQAPELEAAVLGAIMLEKEKLAEVLEIIQTPEAFYVDANQKIYAAIRSLFDKGAPVDLLTVTEELRKNNELELVGGAYYITSLTMNVVTAAHVEAHARLVMEKFIQRELIRISSSVISDAYEDSTDVFDLLDKAESHLYEITDKHLRKNFKSLKEVLLTTIQEIEQAKDTKEDVTGVPSGFSELDRITGGWQKTDLIILAARPAVGKTAFALNLAMNAALASPKPFPVAVFSLEMGAGQLVRRMLSAVTEVSMEGITKGRMEEHEFVQLSERMHKLAKAPIFLDDQAALNIFELRAKARRLKQRHDIKMILIDYLQLMTAGVDNKGNREQEISKISRDMKALAKELEIPIIALSQLNRSVESRKESKMPQLSDLRECVTGDTLVWLADGSQQPIRELVGTTPSVWTIDEHQKIVVRSSDKVWKVGTKAVKKLTMASGRVLRATGQHKMLAFNGWKTINDLAPGERLAVTRQMPNPDICETCPNDQLIVLAHLIGDGSYLSHQPLRYTTASQENSDIVRRSAAAAFGVRVNRHESKGNWHQLVFSGNGNRWSPQGLNKWLREVGIYNQRSFQKVVPSFVFRLSNEQIGLFLCHLWATDGTIFTPKPGQRTASKISFSTNSFRLANDVSSLLLRLGIVARMRTVKQGKSYRDMYVADVCGQEAQALFLQKVGAFGPKKEQAGRLKNHLQSTIANTNVDTVPAEVFAMVKQRMKLQHISQRKMAALRGTSYGASAHFNFAPSRKTLAGYAALLNDKEVEDLATNDIFWDTVVSIEDDGVEDVFDLTVPDTANWIANAGIITHNSGAIEQDADMVMFLYRPEYYGINNDEMGQAVEGETHVSIAKHRNGETGVVKVRFVKHFQKFENFDDGFGNGFMNGGGGTGGSGGFGGGGFNPGDNPMAGIKGGGMGAGSMGGSEPDTSEFGGSKMFIPGGFQTMQSKANDFSFDEDENSPRRQPPMQDADEDAPF